MRPRFLWSCNFFCNCLEFKCFQALFVEQARAAKERIYELFYHNNSTCQGQYFFFVICPRQVNNFNVTMYFPTLILEDGFEIQTTLRSFLKIAFITELNTFCTFVFHKMWNFENNLNTKFINVILVDVLDRKLGACTVLSSR